MTDTKEREALREMTKRAEIAESMARDADAELRAALASAAERERELDQQLADKVRQGLELLRQLTEAQAKIQQLSRDWLHENSAKNVLIEENAELEKALAEAREALKDCAHVIRQMAHSVSPQTRKNVLQVADRAEAALRRESKGEK